MKDLNMTKGLPKQSQQCPSRDTQRSGARTRTWEAEGYPSLAKTTWTSAPAQWGFIPANYPTSQLSSLSAGLEPLCPPLSSSSCQPLSRDFSIALYKGEQHRLGKRAVSVSLAPPHFSCPTGWWLRHLPAEGNYMSSAFCKLRKGIYQTATVFNVLNVYYFLIVACFSSGCLQLQVKNSNDVDQNLLLSFSSSSLSYSSFHAVTNFLFPNTMFVFEVSHLLEGSQTPQYEVVCM